MNTEEESENHFKCVYKREAREITIIFEYKRGKHAPKTNSKFLNYLLHLQVQQNYAIFLYALDARGIFKK